MRTADSVVQCSAIETVHECSARGTGRVDCTGGILIGNIQSFYDSHPHSAPTTGKTATTAANRGRRRGWWCFRNKAASLRWGRGGVLATNAHQQAVPFHIRTLGHFIESGGYSIRWSYAQPIARQRTVPPAPCVLGRARSHRGCAHPAVYRNEYDAMFLQGASSAAPAPLVPPGA